jgi:hypothetical protein
VNADGSQSKSNWINLRECKHGILCSFSLRKAGLKHDLVSLQYSNIVEGSGGTMGSNFPLQWHRPVVPTLRPVPMD